MKRVSALSERVGSLRKYREFISGKHIPTAFEKAKRFNVEELVQIDINRKIDLEQGKINDIWARLVSEDAPFICTFICMLTYFYPIYLLLYFNCLICI